MVTTVRKEFSVDADLVAALEARSHATGVPVDQIVSEVVRNQLNVDSHFEEYFRDGIRLLRKRGTGRTVTAEEIQAMWEELD